VRARLPARVCFPARPFCTNYAPRHFPAQTPLHSPALRPNAPSSCVPPPPRLLNSRSSRSPWPSTSCMLRVMMEWTSAMSAFSFDMLRCVRVSKYSFFVFWIKVSARKGEPLNGEPDSGSSAATNRTAPHQT
jgi:hypothetical protein